MLLKLFVFGGYVAAFTVPGWCCRAKEYPTHDGQCCPKCREGTVVQRDCTPQSGTRCSPCENGTFMNQPNGLKKCFPCTTCVSAHGLFTQQKCAATTDTVCDVLSGYFCKSVVDDRGCSMAEKHTHCAPGQMIKEPGTSRADTVCEDCQPGYFSQDGVNCTAWTICSETQVKVKEGGLTNDVVCSSAWRNHYFMFMPLTCFLSVTVVGLVTRGRRITAVIQVWDPQPATTCFQVFPAPVIFTSGVKTWCCLKSSTGRSEKFGKTS